MYQKNTTANRRVLRMKVNGMQLMEGGSVKDHLKAMTEAFGELSIIGSPMLEEDQIVQLLTSLPPSYKTLVTVLENQDTSDIWDAVTERLLSEEQRSKEDRQLLSPSADEKGHGSHGSRWDYVDSAQENKLLADLDESASRRSGRSVWEMKLETLERGATNEAARRKAEIDRQEAERAADLQLVFE
ncbi:hypothetical protein TCAL_17034 [Tigriopus californicus]|uniref:Retrovirus-related Pol polyprotein from transposon TNT 1-94 n=1 Tax=Tigriopus californicus TaxID=6832 RepID=A0A553PHQ7_TIGCA|nr:hypothetical protein TCAL_17034 [Tigriopus californicus]